MGGGEGGLMPSAYTAPDGATRSEGGIGGGGGGVAPSGSLVGDDPDWLGACRRPEVLGSSSGSIGVQIVVHENNEKDSSRKE